MTFLWKISLLIIFSTYPSVDGSYYYVGCFTQVFYDSFFTSSSMEPLLCFRLCNTPIIYLQNSICRCSGGGVMHHNRQDDKKCYMLCAKSIDSVRSVEDTCGGIRTYSAYMENDFYSRHGHLLNYQIQFSSCESWTIDDIYNTKTIRYGNLLRQSSLNKLERCAAACLDYNATTKSIAFNNGVDQCLCIMPWTTETSVKREVYVKILANNSCNYYCNNTFDDSVGEHKFQCGSLSDSRIWTIYDLNGICPSDFTYIKEINKCMYAYQYSMRSCPPPSIGYTYNGNITWGSFLQIIERLGLKNSTVIVYFTANIVISSSLICPTIATTTSSRSSFSSYSESFNYPNIWGLAKRYILQNGCILDENASKFSSYQFANYLCILEPVNKYSSLSDTEFGSYNLFESAFLQQFCPMKWLDLNGRCYRMSDEQKSIQDAKSSCISIPQANKDQRYTSFIRTNVDKDDDDDNDDDDDGSEEQLNMTPKGDIVQYTSLWQVRLGFFFLDKIRESDASSTDTSTRSFNAYYEDLTPLVNENASYNVNNHEFQMIDPTENNNSSITDDSCIISTRTYVETEERPVIKTISMKNCSKPRYALCETKRLIVDNFQQGCFRKPLIMDLPALISTRLTHELCLTVCKELQTTLVLIHINKCYCLNNYVLRKLNLTIDLGKYQQNKCGQPCKGNSHEQCGDDDTIVVFDIMESQQSNLFRRKPLEIYPDFIYDSCIQTNSFHPNTSYKFVFNDTINLHSRHCLELCTKYEQKYALINSNQCFCTNIPIKNGANNIRILANQMCSQICSANYFYTCGSQIDPAIYSMYIKRPKCRHNFEVAQNDEQCVYSHYSNLQDSYALAQSYCNSLGSEIAKVSNTLELQEILSKSIISSHLYLWKILMNYRSSSSSIDFPRYFWIDRSVDTLNNYNVSYNLFTKCSQLPDKPDRNCLALIMKRTLNETELCITESNQCSSASAIPVCVDPKFQSKSNVLISPYRNDELSEISTNILSDYSCGDNQTDYHFVDEYCYKISFHEVSWNQAKSECERDNAMLFVPEKALTLKYIRSLFLHRTNYASSGYAHVGVIYDNQNRTVIQYNNDNNKTVEFIPDSNTVYDICEVTFHERYSALVSSMNERNRIKEQQIGCAYIDLLADIEPVIRCDEIPCNRTATVICQKLPLVKTKVVIVKREQIIPSLDSHSKSVPSMSSSSEHTKSIGRDFAPIFFILIILFTFILLGFISILYNHRILSMGLNQRRQNINPVYSQLTLISEFNTD